MITDHALRLAKGETDDPIWSQADYENAMRELAKSAARDGESPEVAFVRLLDERDSRMLALSVGAYAARVGKAAADAEQWRDDTDSGRRVEKRAETREVVWAEMVALAKAGAQPDETREAAMSRLLDSSSEMRDAYRRYREA